MIEIHGRTRLFFTGLGYKVGTCFSLFSPWLGFKETR